MANISVTPPGFDRNDPEGTLKRLCEYEAKLHEELSWLISQLEKKIAK